MKRPTGVTILAVLALIGGAIEILGALGAIGILLAAMAAGGIAAAGGSIGGASLAAAGIVGIFVTLWLGVLGVVSVIYGVGALGLKPWAWTIGVIWCYVAAASDVLNVFTSRGSGIFGAIIGILIAIAILYYLFTDEVRGAFGKMDKEPPSFMVPVFEQIDKLLSNRRSGTPQAPGGYQPPQAPGGYQPPTMPANYQAPPAPTMPPADIPAPAAPPAPPE